MKGRILLFFIFVLLGASAGSAAGMAATLLIEGMPYVSLYSFGSFDASGHEWDPLLKNLTVTGPKGSIKFHVGSPYILSGGKVFKLNEAVRFFNGSVVAPVSAAEYLAKINPPQSLKAAPPQILFTPAHRIKRVVVDAGHGGQDHGATSPRGTVEKEVVLDLAEGLRGELEKRGIEVIMTRSADVYVPLDERVEIAEERRADFFISVHANASTTESLQGFEVYWLSESAADALLESRSIRDTSAIVRDLLTAENRRESFEMAGFIAEAVQGSVHISARRIKEAGFYVLKKTQCPAVLVETGYLTNREDEERLKDPLYRERLVRAIAQGVMSYKAEFERTDGFTL